MADLKKTAALLEDVRRFPEFAETYLRIQPVEGGQLIPFKLNQVQLWYFWNYIVPSVEAGVPLRDAILKSRQMGFSTLIQGFDIYWTYGHHNYNSSIIAKDKKQMLEFFRMMRRYGENLQRGAVLPEFYTRGDAVDMLHFGKPPAKMMKQFEGRTDVVFLESVISTKSSQEKGALGRSGTNQFVHASEAAFWPKLHESLAALLSCCHDVPGTFVFVETTANGMNAFHNFWQNLRIGELEVPSLWRKVFIPWYWDDRYELEILKVKHNFSDEYEEWLYQHIKGDQTLRGFDTRLTEARIWGKIFWRRRTIIDKMFGDVDKFRQEFPATDTEAFLFSGVSIFPGTAINRVERELKNPVWTGHIELTRNKDDVPEAIPSVVKTTPHEHGRLKVWEQPQVGAAYALGCDVAEGKAAEGIAENKTRWDFSVIQVLRIDLYPPKVKQVAVWHGNSDPDLFGSIIVAMALYYNKAFAAWEMNGPGRSLALQIVDRHRYSNIHMREDTDMITKRATMKPGWKTTRRTKPELVSCAQRFIRMNEIEILDAGTLAEMKTFSRIGENQYGASTGHDDRIISLGICLITAEPIIGLVKRQLDEAKRRAEEEKDKKFFRTDEDAYDPILGSEW